MTVAELTSRIMALPAAERAVIAQRVWESLEDEPVSILPETDAEAAAVAQRRDQEMSQGDVPQRAHEEVINDAKRSLKCE